MKSFTLHFGLRGWQEYLHMKMEDFIFKELKGSKDALPPCVWKYRTKNFIIIFNLMKDFL